MSFAIFDMDFISSIDTDFSRLKLLIYFCTEDGKVHFCCCCFSFSISCETGTLKLLLSKNVCSVSYKTTEWLLAGLPPGSIDEL